jgi:hypothetical protein
MMPGKLRPVDYKGIVRIGQGDPYFLVQLVRDPNAALNMAGLAIKNSEEARKVDDLVALGRKTFFDACGAAGIKFKESCCQCGVGFGCCNTKTVVPKCNK